MLVEANFEITQMMIDKVDPNFESLTKIERKYVLTMLNYYEFISTALRMGALDKKSLLVQRYGLMRSTFTYFKPFIDYRRNRLNRPHAFEGVEYFVKKEARNYEALCKKYEVKKLDSFRRIDRKSAIDRSLRYPYEIPKSSYLFHAGSVTPIVEPYNQLIKNRVPVIGYGSNASSEALNRKFKDDASLYNTPVPVLVGSMDDYSVVYAAQFSPYGALPATIQPNKGAILVTSITFLSLEQLERMHETEDLGFYYSYEKIESPIVLDDGSIIEESYAYVALGGSIKIEGQYFGLSAINQSFSNGEMLSQKEIQSLVIKELGINISVEDFITENALSEKLRNSRFKKLSDKVGSVWQK